MLETSSCCQTLVSLELIELSLLDDEVPALFSCFASCTQLTRLRLAHEAAVRSCVVSGMCGTVAAAVPAPAASVTQRGPCCTSRRSTQHWGGMDSLACSHRAARAGVCSDGIAQVAKATAQRVAEATALSYCACARWCMAARASRHM